MKFRRLAAFAACCSVAAGIEAQEVTSYTYDALGRLVGSGVSGTVNSGAARKICYDAAGNRTAIVSATSGTAACAQSGSSFSEFSVSDAAAIEGQPVVFTVSRTGPLADAVTVNYATAPGTAGSADFTAKSGTLSFGIGVGSLTVSVTTTNDTALENDEQFTLNLSAPSGNFSSIADSEGVGTIIDNDEPPETCLTGSSSSTLSEGDDTSDQSVSGETQAQALPPPC